MHTQKTAAGGLLCPFGQRKESAKQRCLVVPSTTGVSLHCENELFTHSKWMFLPFVDCQFYDFSCGMKWWLGVGGYATILRILVMSAVHSKCLAQWLKALKILLCLEMQTKKIPSLLVWHKCRVLLLILAMCLNGALIQVLVLIYVALSYW